MPVGAGGRAGPDAGVGRDAVVEVAPGQDPVGQRLRSNPGAPWAEVVGVVAPLRHESLDRDQRWQIYWNYLQRPRDRVTLMVRTTGETRLLAGPVLAALASASWKASGVMDRTWVKTGTFQRAAI